MTDLATGFLIALLTCCGLPVVVYYTTRACSFGWRHGALKFEEWAARRARRQAQQPTDEPFQQ